MSKFLSHRTKKVNFYCRETIVLIARKLLYHLVSDLLIVLSFCFIVYYAMLNYIFSMICYMHIDYQIKKITVILNTEKKENNIEHRKKR